jgi:uncharacterized protein YgiB involved in biofilm formation
MTQPENEYKKLELRKIRRNKIYTGLAIAGVLAIMLATCSDSDDELMTEEEVNEQIHTVFYQTTAQCEADTKKQQDEYGVLLKKYEKGEIAEVPTAPPMTPQDCAPQMQAAKQEHDRVAPKYSTMADCQAEGVTCEIAPSDAHAIESTESLSTTYRPVYGGTYIDPYYHPSYTYINYGGVQHRVYESRSVYQSVNPGAVVTPYGREISQTATGRTIAPRHSTFAAPARPTGTSGTGTIKGRSSQGFGSSFKSTGHGGK